MKQKIILISFGVVFGLTLAELIVRILGIAPEIAPLEVSLPWGQFMSIDDPILNYIPRPGSSGINSKGLRWKEVSTDKVALVKRVLILGDSAGFGYCSSTKALSVEETFAGVLDLSLKKSQLPTLKNLEVINLSVSGYDTLQEVHFLKKVGLDLRPDIIIVLFHPNDFMGEDASEELYQLRNNQWFHIRSSLLLPMLKHCSIARIVFGLLRRPMKDEERSHDSRIPIRDRTPLAFSMLSELGIKHNFNSIILPYPYRGYLQANELPHYCAPLMSWDEIINSLKIRISNFSFRLVDPLPLFRDALLKEGDTIYSSECDCLHPSKRENELLVSSVISVLEDVS